MENMFEKGCLVQLSAAVWGATRKVKTEKLSDEVSEKWLSASKKLVDPDSLKPVTKVVNAARSYLAGVTLPFPLQGMAFIPKEMIGRVDEKLELFKGDFSKTVESFLGSYDNLREVAMLNLGDLFNEYDYPLDVKAKFAFTWRFVILDVYNGHPSMLSASVYVSPRGLICRIAFAV